MRVVGVGAVRFRATTEWQGICAPEESPRDVQRGSIPLLARERLGRTFRGILEIGGAPAWNPNSDPLKNFGKEYSHF